MRIYKKRLFEKINVKVYSGYSSLKPFSIYLVEV